MGLVKNKLNILFFMSSYICTVYKHGVNAIFFFNINKQQPKSCMNVKIKIK